MFNNFFNFEKIFDSFNYVFWFFLLNLFFILFNIPVTLFFVFVGISKVFEYFPLFLLCLLPTMPTFTALLYCMNKIILNKDLNILKDFYNGLKLNFKQAFLIWAAELLITFVLYFNIRFFSTTSNNIVLVCLFAAVAIVLLIVTPFIFILISRFKIDNITLIKNAFILCFTRPVLAITNLLLFILMLVLFEITPGTAVLFMFSLFSFLLMFINKSLLRELEDLSQNQI